MIDLSELEAAIWSIADGRGSADDLARLHADERASLVVLDRLIIDVEDDLASARSLVGDERDQVVADLAESLDSLRGTVARLRRPITPATPERRPAEPIHSDEVEPAEVELQASWSSGQVVVWAAGRGAKPESHDDLSTRLEAIGGPPLGWQLHPGVQLPGGGRAEALAIPVKDALGWLVAVGGGHGRAGVGAGVLWLGHVALEAVRLAASGSIVPSLRVPQRREGRLVNAEVRWRPALADSPMIAALTEAMPATVTAIDGGHGRAITSAVITAVVEAIATESVERMELPAPPPTVKSMKDVNDALIARMDGSPFRAPAALAGDVSRALENWTRTVTSPSRPRLVVQVDAPGTGGVWLLSVHAPSAKGRTVPIDAALRTDRGSRPVSSEWARLRRLLPALDRSTAQRRGQVALSQDEAWQFMTVDGPGLAAVGFDVRAPALSRRRATPSLRLFTETPAGSVVGASQLSNVAWAVLFDDVELTAAEVAQLARQARPLVMSSRGWVEIDRVDLEQAAAALAEREQSTQLTGADILRYSIGLDGPGLRGGVEVRGHSWATDIVDRAGAASTAPVTRPDGFAGELRAYQAEALAWLGFLDAAELGGCLALDMGLGKTPTVLAQLARTTASGSALVVAPAAVVGNWAAEAARFVPELRVVVHHGASRSAAAQLEAEIAEADVVITTYATAVRDVEALAAVSWGTIVLDEAQAIKNPSSETAVQLRRIPAGSASRSPAHRSRTGSAICGPSWTSPTQGSSAPGRRSSPSCQATAIPP